jgi:formate-dependent nitrite reductase membrane component NrfD
MSAEIFQLAAEHGSRSGAVYWSWEIALEMFMGGIAGSLMFFAAVRRFAPDVRRRIERVVLGSLTAAGLVLFLDLGAKLHMLRLFTAWRPGSVLFWGGWVLVFAFASALLRWRFAAGVAGLALMLYPGLLLASMEARRAWPGASVPIAFLTLSLGSGAAVILLADPVFRSRTVWARPVAFCVLAAVFVARWAILLRGQS